MSDTSPFIVQLSGVLAPISRLRAPSNNSASVTAAPSPDALAWTASQHAKPRAQLLAELVEENDWKNDMVMWMLPETVQERMPRVVKAWFRCYVMAMAL